MVEQDNTFENVLIQKRHRLDELIDTDQWEAIRTFPEIQLVQTGEENRQRGAGGNCITYIEQITGRKISEILSSYHAVQTQEAGDVIVYYNDKNFTHVGLAHNKEQVISKWNAGDILYHPTKLVPAQYGEDIQILRNLDQG